MDHRTSRLSPYQAAIDWDHGSGHIVGQVGGEELDHLGAVLDGPEPPKCDQLGSITIALNAARNNCRHNPSVAITPGAIQLTVIPKGSAVISSA